MIKNQNKKFLAVAVFVLFYVGLVSPAIGRAAEFNFVLDSQDIKVGDQFEVDFFLSARDESINAVESAILFPRELVELKEIKNGNSIISFWSQAPRFFGDKIRFSGVIPGGFSGADGPIFSAVFQARAKGEGEIEMGETTALLNDGKGTQAQIKISKLRFKVAGQDGASLVSRPTADDTEPPGSFKPAIGRDETIYDGQFFLVFAAQDKGSGIDSYEVCEGKRECVKAEGLYLLKNQNLNEEIIVKAIDKAGNERAVVLPPQKPKSRYAKYFYFAIMIIGAMLLARVYAKRKKK